MNRFKILGFLLLAVFTISSCSKDDITNINPTIIQETLEAGEWRIANFTVAGVNDMDDFVGYRLNFESNGEIFAINNTSSYAGNWNVTDSQSSDNLIDDLDFNILFDSSSSFQKINAAWDILSRTDNKIELVHFGNPSEGTRFLTIEKN